jgi:hypothetical protein
MLAMNIHENAVSGLMPKKNRTYCSSHETHERKKNLIYNWHEGDDKIPSSDNRCHLGIEVNYRFKATERTINVCRIGRNAFFCH